MFEQIVLVRWGGDGVAVETFVSDRSITSVRVVAWFVAHYVGFDASTDTIEFVDPSSDFRTLDD